MDTKDDNKEHTLSEQQQIRREKLLSLQESGNNPFATVRYQQTHHSKTIKGNFEQLETQTVSIAGRLMSFRNMGKAAFADVQDRYGRIQIYCSSDELGADGFARIKSYDIGDIVGVTGIVFRTKRLEISVRAKEITLLTKALEPLPEKYHGLKDPELCYRRRYLDLIMNRSSMDTFLKRSLVISGIRSFLAERDFIEVETPILATLASGAAARPFITWSKALDLQLFLRIATELYLKRCIVGGMERVYDMGKNFRNEGIDTRHNPEFTMIELYQAYSDYNDMMILLETLVSRLAQDICGSFHVEYQGHILNFTTPWKRVTMYNAIIEGGGPDFNKIKDDVHARTVAKQLNLESALKKSVENCSRGDIIIAAFEKYAESSLLQPTFVLDYPVEISPLTKQKPGDPSLTERFEAFIFGREIANAYSELNDPLVQKVRFEEQLQERQKGDDEAYVLDDDFIAALEVGMPPTGGMGIGVDRLVMFLTNASSIRDVILFPTMKPE